jgi:hypothetical protein
MSGLGGQRRDGVAASEAKYEGKGDFKTGLGAAPHQESKEDKEFKESKEGKRSNAKESKRSESKNGELFSVAISACIGCLVSMQDRPFRTSCTTMCARCGARTSLRRCRGFRPPECLKALLF